MGLSRFLIIPDVHAPYHDKRALRLLYKVLDGVRFKGCVVLGDWFDCYAVSQHRKDPRRERSIAKELLEARQVLQPFTDYPFKHRTFIEGNHEWRLSRMVIDQAPELYDLIDSQDVFGLAGKWKWVPYMQDIKIGAVNFTHDLGKSGPGALLSALHDYMDNVVIGHTHRFEHRVEGNAKGIPHVAASFGWLGDYRKIDYRHQMKSRRDWVLGFGYGYYDSRTRLVYLHPVPIIDYSVVVDGRLFSV